MRCGVRDGCEKLYLNAELMFLFASVRECDMYASECEKITTNTISNNNTKDK